MCVHTTRYKPEPWSLWSSWSTLIIVDEVVWPVWWQRASRGVLLTHSSSKWYVPCCGLVCCGCVHYFYCISSTIPPLSGLAGQWLSMHENTGQAPVTPATPSNGRRESCSPVALRGWAGCTTPSNSCRDMGYPSRFAGFKQRNFDLVWRHTRDTPAC